MPEAVPPDGQNVCPKCGDRYYVSVRCLAGNRSYGCNFPHRLMHTHYGCTQCQHEWVEEHGARPVS